MSRAQTLSATGLRQSTWVALLGLSSLASLPLGAGCLGTEYDREANAKKTAAGGQGQATTHATLAGTGGTSTSTSIANASTLLAQGGASTSLATDSTAANTTTMPLGGAGGGTIEALAVGGYGLVGSSTELIVMGGAAAGGATATDTDTLASAGASGAQCGNPALIGPALRPQLRPETAANYTIAQYLAQAGTLGSLVRDDWDPTAGLGNIDAFTPAYTVAADGTGTHTTVQAAVDAAIAEGGPNPAYIRLMPGAYEEAVCVDSPRPITIYGAGTDPAETIITSSNNAGKSRDDLQNRCAVLDAAATTYTILGSSTFVAKSNSIQLKNLTLANEFVEDSNVWAAGQQAVALYTYGDRIVLDDVRVLGNHYTVVLDTPDPNIVSRVYVKESYIAGDMQYITGRGTAVFDRSEIHFLPARLSSPMGSLMAASTAGPNGYGFLIANSRLTVLPDSGFNWVLLGRSWDVGTKASEWVLGASPNGHILIRDSFIGDHIKMDQPWGNALETVRLYDCFKSRLYEYNNTGPGALIL